MIADDEAARPELSDREIWACALQVAKQHGDRMHIHIAERIGALALVGDIAGVHVWKRIANRIDRLSTNSQARRDLPN